MAPPHSSTALSGTVEASRNTPARRHLRHENQRLYTYLLVGILTVQAALSLSLVWSNTAFSDEADYLWLGHLEIAHWMDGATWPSTYADHVLSGSPIIYPPLGAVADSVGGLAAARMLSLLFMLVTTVLLYLTASRLLGRTGAVAAAAIWAFSEPALRLAFATFDPLSVLLTAVSAWLVVEATYSRRRGKVLVVAAALCLALANATAYSGIVIDPIVITFAFLVWLPRMSARRSSLYVVFFTAFAVGFFALLLTASRSWAGIDFTIFNRSGTDRQGALLILQDIWTYSGLIICIVIIGLITAMGIESKRRAALLGLVGCAAFVVPLAQLYDQTAWSLDKHLAYGIWFGAIVAGYTFAELIRWLPSTGKQFGVACCIMALAYPAAASWESAWQVYHSWANARSFVAALAPVVARTHGLIYTVGQEHVAEYYTPQGREWARWTTAIPLTPPAAPSQMEQYYKINVLAPGDYGVIALFYPTSFSSAPGLSWALLSSSADHQIQGLLDAAGDSSGEPGLPALTQALLKDRAQYRLVSKGQYDGLHNYGIFAIWQKKSGT